MALNGEVVVLMGGFSKEREISLNSGGEILSSLLRSGVRAIPFDPKERPLLSLKNSSLSAAFNVLHGSFGEDGFVQGLLEFIQLPYTGSGLGASALAMDKIKTKKIWNANKLNTPNYVALKKGDTLDITDLDFPVIVKPNAEGSSLGVTKVNAGTELEKVVQQTYDFGSVILIERFIQGRELTCALLELGDTNELTALPIVEIKAPNGNYDYHNKYFSNETKYSCPALIPKDVENTIKKMAIEAFSCLDCRHWGRVDFIWREGQEPFLLEVNTIPGMTSHSLVPMAAKNFGLSFDDLVLRILKKASLINKGGF